MIHSTPVSPTKGILIFVCLTVCVNVTVKMFSHAETEPLLPVYYQYFRGVKCLAQGLATVEVVFVPQPFAVESDDLPLSHRALRILIFTLAAMLSACHDGEELPCYWSQKYIFVENKYIICLASLVLNPAVVARRK